MKWRWILASPLVLMLLLGATPIVLAQPGVSPEAEKIVQEMCDLLRSQGQFIYHAEVAYEKIGDDGAKVKSSFNSKTFVRRPDRLRVDATGQEVNKDLYFDGKMLTLHDKTDKVYGVIDVPDDIEGALDKAHKDFGLRVALADLASPKLGELMLRQPHDSKYVGKETIRGIPCHHVELSREDVQAQLWIDAGQDPLPRKVIITHIGDPDGLQWTADLTGWDLDPKLADDVFIFTAPEGTQKIKFVPMEQVVDPQPDDLPGQEGAQP